MSTKVTITAHCTSADRTPTGVYMVNYFTTLDEAQAFAANFPKSVGVRVHELGGDPEHQASIHWNASLIADGVNGGRNETGIRRYRRLMKGLRQLGVEIEFGRQHYTNAYASLDDFETTIG